MWPLGTSFGLPLRPLLGGFWRGQRHGIQLKSSAVGGLAQTEWTKFKKDAGHSPEGHTTPLFFFFAPLLVSLCGKGLQLLQLLGAQTNPLSLQSGGCDLWGRWLRWGRQGM